MCYSDIVIRGNVVGHSTYHEAYLDRQIPMEWLVHGPGASGMLRLARTVMGQNDQKEERLRPPTPFHSAASEVPDAVPPRLKNE